MDIFWSYAKLDNKEPRKLTALKNAFNISLDQTMDFENKIIMDVSDLKWGVKWKEELTILVSNADAFIAIMSPSYFNSKMCMFELDIALSKKKIILPLYYRDCIKGLKSEFKENNEENIRLNKVSLKLSDIQYKDFRVLRNKALNSEIVQDFLDAISISLA